MYSSVIFSQCAELGGHCHNPGFAHFHDPGGSLPFTGRHICHPATGTHQWPLSLQISRCCTGTCVLGCVSFPTPPLTGISGERGRKAGHTLRSQFRPLWNQDRERWAASSGAAQRHVRRGESCIKVPLGQVRGQGRSCLSWDGPVPREQDILPGSRPFMLPPTFHLEFASVFLAWPRVCVSSVVLLRG